jgi:mannitol-1-phosphate 5-dehydrogenase
MPGGSSSILPLFAARRGIILVSLGRSSPCVTDSNENMTRTTLASAVQFGAGNIGRGFMGQLLREAGFALVFVDADASLVGRLNERGSYPLRLLDAYSRTARDLTIDRFTALSTIEKDAIAAALANARVVATAVGVANLDAIAPLLARGLRQRWEGTAEPLDVYLGENMLGAAEVLSGKVISLLDGPAAAWVRRNIGFVGTSVARIVGGAGTRSVQDDPLLVIADAHRDTPYDGRACRAGDPRIPGLHPVSNFKAEVERKIFTHNVGHAALAYLGYLRGHTFIHETFADDFVKSVFEGALDETTEALLRRYPADLDRREHLEIRRDVRVRFGNSLLGDAIVRVAKDPIRKLGRDDRIIGAAELCRAQGVTPHHIATICTAALCYDYPDDMHAVRLQMLLRERGPEEALRQISGVEPSSGFGREVRKQYPSLHARVFPDSPSRTCPL